MFCPFERQYSAWIGGSILGKTGAFENLSIKRSDYYEVGPQIMNLNFD